jgi:uncharacterized membrane protein
MRDAVNWRGPCTVKPEGENAGRLSVVVYLLFAIGAVLVFLCVAHVVPEFAKGSLAQASSSQHGPMRKYTFPTVDGSGR